jgi:hypothetical protein
MAAEAGDVRRWSVSLRRCCWMPGPDGTGRVVVMFRTRTGLAACANVLRRALRFLLLYFAQTASPILVLRRWRDARANQVEHARCARRGRRCPVGATLRERLEKSARGRSVARSFHAHRAWPNEAAFGREVSCAVPAPSRFFQRSRSGAALAANGDRHARAPTGHRLPRPPNQCGLRLTVCHQSRSHQFIRRTRSAAMLRTPSRRPRSTD